MDELKRTLLHASDETLLTVFATLTHRLHVADRKKGPEAAVLAQDIRTQRDRVQDEILRRMKRWER